MSTKLSKKLERINSSVSKIRQKTNMPDAVIEDLATAVESMVTPEGSITITENSTVDVSNYAEAIVNVAGGGSSTKSNIYKVSTIEERDAITDMVEGDVCVVYYANVSNATATSEFQKAKFPNIVVLPEAVTDYIDLMYRATDHSIMFDCWGSLDSSSFRMDCSTDTGNIRISYTSNDGITYTRTDGGNESVDFGTTIKHDYPEMWNDAIGYFILIGALNFDGIFTYSNNSWVYSDIGFPLSPSDIFKDIKAYSNSGIITGTLSSEVSSSFDDRGAEVLTNLLLAYNSLEEIIAPEIASGLYEYSNILTIPLNPTTFQPILNTSNVTNMDRMFYGCNKLKIIPKLDTSKVTTMGDTFRSCTNLKIIPKLDTSNVTSMSGMFHDCSNLETIPQLDTSKVTYMNSMFYGCTNLKTIPSFNTSNVTNMDATFYECSNLEAIPQLDTSKVTTMDRTFEGCNKLRTIHSLNTSNVTTMASLFGWCNSLEVVPQLDTSKVTMMAGMFCGCSSLETIPQLSTSNVTAMDSMFSYCTNLKTIPQLNTSKVIYMSSMFLNCTSLEELDLSNWNTYNVTSMRFMFQGCTSLRHLDIRNFSFSKVNEYNDMFKDVPNDCLIIVKDSTAKSWITSKFANLTNVKTVAEYGA